MLNERATTTARTVAAACIVLFLAGCGSGTHHSITDDGLGNTPPIITTPPPPSLPPPSTPPPTTPVTQVTLTGVVTFDRVPFKSAIGAGLNFAGTTHAPVRGATVELIAASGGAVLATTQTSTAGAYSFTVPASTQVMVRVKAELVKTGTPAWNVRVRDNTSGNALYVLDSAAFSSGTVATLTRDFNAASGWSTTAGAYVGTRSAAPFALLDTAYQSMQLVMTADASIVFPELDFFWSPLNVAVEGDVTLGEIVTTEFNAPVGAVPASIYVLGKADEDTDEFDTHVIAHEWGHYYQYEYSRDDSMGGDHDPLEQLDLRVAFSEGWGDAFSGMVLGEPLYRDSYDTGASADFGANLESGVVPDRGWYSEGSIALMLYDLFDGGAGDDDAIQIGFGPIHEAMKSLRTTPAFTGIHPFLSRVLLSAAAQAGAITALAAQHHIVAAAANDFAQAETNNGGDPINLPVYTTLNPGNTKLVCSTGAPGQTYNKLGNLRLLRITVAAPYNGTLKVITVDPGADDDVVIYQNGVEVTRSDALGNESKVISLAAGTYVLEAYESSNIFADFLGDTPIGDTCMNVSLTP